MDVNKANTSVYWCGRELKNAPQAEKPFWFAKYSKLVIRDVKSGDMEMHHAGDRIMSAASQVDAPDDALLDELSAIAGEIELAMPGREGKYASQWERLLELVDEYAKKIHDHS